MKIPRLNSHVFVVCCGSVSKVQVLYKNREGFVHNECLDPDIAEEYRVPLFYEEYGEKWFSSIKEIKDKFNCKLLKITDNYWEIRR